MDKHFATKNTLHGKRERVHEERVHEERVKKERVEEICVFSPPSPPARRVLVLLVGV